MYLIALCVLIAILCWMICIAHKHMSNLSSTDLLSSLQYKYFAVYFPATFADWLQGPYLYKLYSSYGFSDDDVFILFITGFASSVVFGTCISSLADYYGRKKMCIVFNAIYILSCLTKLSNNFKILLFGRFLGGIGSSILFSVFEAWYIHQHIEKHQFPLSWINNTLSKTTFFNGLLAIFAGIISNIFAESFEMGPVFPFMLAVPCLILSACLAALLWDETYMLHSNQCFDMCNTAKCLLRKEVILLCFIQCVFESVMYVFIILWTPVLSPTDPPLGITFSCFMISIMIGSSFHTWLVTKLFKPSAILSFAMLLGSAALGGCALAEIGIPTSCSYMCFVSFLFYEVSVGLYYPVIGFFRSCIIPDHFRACITSWFRMPMNLVTCLSLLYFHHRQLGGKSISSKSIPVPGKLTNNVQTFGICALVLLGASILSKKLRVSSHQGDHSYHHKNKKSGKLE